MKPALITFDIFGTVVDWQRGLADATRAAGRPLADGDFDRIIDHQGREEQRQPHASYREITAVSLESELGLHPEAAQRIGVTVGR